MSTLTRGGAGTRRGAVGSGGKGRGRPGGCRGSATYPRGRTLLRGPPPPPPPFPCARHATSAPATLAHVTCSRRPSRQGVVPAPRLKHRLLKGPGITRRGLGPAGSKRLRVLAPPPPGPLTQAEPPPDPGVDDGLPVSEVFPVLALWPSRLQGTRLSAEPRPQLGSRDTRPQGHPGKHSAKAPRRVAGAQPQDGPLSWGESTGPFGPATALPRTSASPFAKRPGPSPGTPVTCLGSLCGGCERTGGKGRAALRLRCVLIYRGNDCAASLSWKGKVPRWGPRAEKRRAAVIFPLPGLS